MEKFKIGYIETSHGYPTGKCLHVEESQLFVWRRVAEELTKRVKQFPHLDTRFLALSVKKNAHEYHVVENNRNVGFAINSLLNEIGKLSALQRGATKNKKKN